MYIFLLFIFSFLFTDEKDTLLLISNSLQLLTLDSVDQPDVHLLADLDFDLTLRDSYFDLNSGFIYLLSDPDCQIHKVSLFDVEKKLTDVQIHRQCNLSYISKLFS